MKNLTILILLAGVNVFSYSAYCDDDGHGTLIAKDRFISPQTPSDLVDCTRNGKDGKNIADANHPLVQEAKGILLRGKKITPKYFEQHFTFLCATEGVEARNVTPYKIVSYSPAEVRFQYKIGDFTVIFQGYVDDRGRFTDFDWDGKNFREIKVNMSKEQAKLKMNSCVMGSRNEIYLTTKGLFLVRSGRPVPPHETKNPVNIGYLNLETGDCSIRSMNPIK